MDHSENKESCQPVPMTQSETTTIDSDDSSVPDGGKKKIEEEGSCSDWHEDEAIASHAESEIGCWLSR